MTRLTTEQLEELTRATSELTAQWYGERNEVVIERRIDDLEAALPALLEEVRELREAHAARMDEIEGLCEEVAAMREVVEVARSRVIRCAECGGKGRVCPSGPACTCGIGRCSGSDEPCPDCAELRAALARLDGRKA